MALELKYRPDSFEKFLGIENRGLVNAMREVARKRKGNLPHKRTFLLYGPSGCGKTSMARIMGKELNNETLNSKKTTEIQEYNLSNTGGVETAREIIEDTAYPPLIGDVKIFILDEVHMTSKNFQNAMLKVLEEPPSKVYFFLCTTEPNKLLKTVRDRCASYQVCPLKNSEMTKFLRSVAKGEGIPLSPKVRDLIRKQSEGSPRKALVMLEKVGGLETEEEILQVIEEEAAESPNLLFLCEMILKGEDFPTVMQLLDEMEEDEERLRRGMLKLLLAKARMTGDKAEVKRLMEIMSHFESPYYNTGRPGLYMSCYRASREKTDI